MPAVDEVWDESRGERRGDTGPGQPSQPGDAHVPGFPGELGYQRIGRHAGEKHGRRDAVAVESGQHQERSDAPRGGPRLGAAGLRQTARHGIDHAASARGIGGYEGRQQRARRHRGISEPQRTRSETANQQVGDAHPKPGDADGAREQEGGEDQPDGLVGEPGEHARGRHGAGERRQRHGQQNADAHGRRPRHQRDDSGEEDREQVALGRVEARHGEEVEQRAGEQDGSPAQK